MLANELAGFFDLAAAVKTRLPNYQYELFVGEKLLSCFRIELGCGLCTRVNHMWVFTVANCLILRCACVCAFVFVNVCIYLCIRAVVFCCHSSDGLTMQDYFECVALEIDANSEDGTLQDVFGPVLDRIKEKFQKEFSLGRGILYDYLDVLFFFTRTSCLAQVC